MEKKTICTLCQELRECIKYIENPKICEANDIITNVQYRAHDMEKGLYKSKYDVGEKIINYITNNESNIQKCEIEKILKDRWPDLFTSSNTN